jgi:hypothetical protein
MDALVFGREIFKRGFCERKERWKECKIRGKDGLRRVRSTSRMRWIEQCARYGSQISASR